MSLKTFAVGFSHLVLSFVLMASMPAMAQTNAATVAPLGFAVGKATLKEVKAGVPGGAKLSNEGTNRYSKGPMFKAQGRAFDIEGLQDVWFVFDEREALVAVQMTMAKSGFERVYQNLAGKYRLVSKDTPFVGNKSACFQQGDIVIELEAPHMSFEMTVTYKTTGFEKQAEAGVRQESAKKQKRETGQF